MRSSALDWRAKVDERASGALESEGTSLPTFRPAERPGGQVGPEAGGLTRLSLKALAFSRSLSGTWAAAAGLTNCQRQWPT